MQKENLISLDEFCINHNVEIEFISSLQDTGLIEITSIKEAHFIESDQIRLLEKIIRFYYEFDINLEGIETVTNLLDQINEMQEEILALRNRLRLYESNE